MSGSSSHLAESNPPKYPKRGQKVEPGSQRTSPELGHSPSGKRLTESTKALGKAIFKQVDKSATAVATKVNKADITKTATEKGRSVLQGAKTKGAKLLDEAKASHAHSRVKDGMKYYCTRLCETMDKATAYLSEEQDTYTLSDVFMDNNVIQLVSDSSGGSVQIIEEEEDELLTLDANGPLNPVAFNTLWNVRTPDPSAQVVQLCNHGNYMAVLEGQVHLVHVPNGESPGPEAGFLVHEVSALLLKLESVVSPGLHVGFSKEGILISLRECDDTCESDIHFGVKIVKKS